MYTILRKYKYICILRKYKYICILRQYKYICILRQYKYICILREYKCICILNSNSNSKMFILKDSSVRSIWTYLTASPCYTTNTHEHDNTTNKYYKHD